MIGDTHTKHGDQDNSQRMKTDKLLSHLRQEVGQLIERQHIDDAKGFRLARQCFGKRDGRANP